MLWLISKVNSVTVFLQWRLFIISKKYFVMKISQKISCRKIYLCYDCAWGYYETILIQETWNGGWLFIYLFNSKLTYPHGRQVWAYVCTYVCMKFEGLFLKTSTHRLMRLHWLQSWLICSKEIIVPFSLTAAKIKSANKTIRIQEHYHNAIILFYFINSKLIEGNRYKVLLENHDNMLRCACPHVLAYLSVHCTILVSAVPFRT